MNDKPKFERKMVKGRVIVVSQKEKISWENYIWNCKNKVVYGPILSRRLGKSLGINLFPSDFNVCTFDCIYCDCGSTKRSPGNTHNFVSMEKIKDKIEHSFEQHLLNRTPIDFITFAGNGEPTYYPFFPKIVDFVIELRDRYFPQKPLAIFTNGTMISDPKIVDSILKLDERIFKLDAGDKKTFNLINRVNNNISLKALVDRLADLKGIKISSAVLCSGIKNFDSLKSSGYIEALRKIGPLEVHLYSIDYPPACSKVKRARISKLIELGEYIVGNINISVKVLQSRHPWQFFYWNEQKIRGVEWVNKRYEIEKFVWGKNPSLTAVKGLPHFKRCNKILVEGCGYARDCVFLAKKGLDVVGVDNAKKGIELGFQWLHEEFPNLKNVQLEVKDIRALPFENNTFDGILSSKVFHQFNKTDRKKVLNEIHRVLKPRGIVVMGTYSANDTLHFGKGRLIENNTYDKRGYRPVHFFLLDEMREFMSPLFNALSLEEIEEYEKHEKPGPHKHLLIFVAGRKKV